MRHPLCMVVVATLLIAAVIDVFAAGGQDKRGHSILLRGTHQRGRYSGAPWHEVSDRIYCRSDPERIQAIESVRIGKFVNGLA